MKFPPLVQCIYPPTKGWLEVCVFIFSFTFLDVALATKTMCTQNLVHSLLYGDSQPSGDVWRVWKNQKTDLLVNLLSGAIDIRPKPPWHNPDVIGSKYYSWLTFKHLSVLKCHQNLKCTLSPCLNSVIEPKKGQWNFSTQKWLLNKCVGQALHLAVLGYILLLH